MSPTTEVLQWVGLDLVLAFNLLGYDNARLYTSSWEEWSRDATVPIEKWGLIWFAVIWSPAGGGGRPSAPAEPPVARYPRITGGQAILSLRSLNQSERRDKAWALAQVDFYCLWRPEILQRCPNMCAPSFRDAST